MNLISSTSLVFRTKLRIAFHVLNTQLYMHVFDATLFAITIPISLQLQDLYKEIFESQEIQLLIQRVKEGDASLKHYIIKDDRLWHKHRLVIPSSSAFITTVLKECFKAVTHECLKQ